jgi:hypothetical protein
MQQMGCSKWDERACKARAERRTSTRSLRVNGWVRDTIRPDRCPRGRGANVQTGGCTDPLRAIIVLSSHKGGGRENREKTPAKEEAFSTAKKEEMERPHQGDNHEHCAVQRACQGGLTRGSPLSAPPAYGLWSATVLIQQAWRWGAQVACEFTKEPDHRKGWGGEEGTERRREGTVHGLNAGRQGGAFSSVRQ